MFWKARKRDGVIERLLKQLCQHSTGKCPKNNKGHNLLLQLIFLFMPSEIKGQNGTGRTDENANIGGGDYFTDWTW